MKHGWTSAALGDVAEIVSGATPKTGVPDFWDGKIPWATPKDLSDLHGATIASTPRTITQSGLRSCAATVLPIGSVLFSSRAPIGHVAINSVPMATNQGFKSLVPREGVLDAKYLYHWLRANRQKLESLGNGATFKEVSKAVVSRVELPLPPIEEQRHIAAILDHVADLTGSSRAAIDSLDVAVDAVFNAMFGQEEWPESTLDDLSLIAGEYGANVPSAEYKRPLPRYIRITDIAADGRLNGEWRAPGGPAEKWSRYRLEVGDMLFARSGATVGKTYEHRDASLDAVFAGYLIRFRPDPARLDATFLNGFTRTAVYRTWVASRQNVVAQPNINARQYGRDLPIPTPPIARQREYARVVVQFDGARNTLQRRLSETVRLGMALQQRAFSGRL